MKIKLSPVQEEADNPLKYAFQSYAKKVRLI